MKKAARMVHHSKEEYNIVPSMREEVDFFAKYLKPGSGVTWESPIAFLIKKMPFALNFGDSCLDAAGGFSIKLRFWWHIVFPPEILHRTLKYLSNNNDGKLTSINVLEYLTVIISYCGALTAIQVDKCADDQYPVLLNIADNISAHNWTTHTCKSSRLGRLLARFFCYLLMDSVLGINSRWISTTDNIIADDISRIKKVGCTSSKQFSFDYSNLQQKYPELKNCRFFQPAPELLSLLWDILLSEKLPSLQEVRTLRQSGLGKLIT